MIELWGKQYTRGELLRRVGDMSQIAQVQPFELVDGNQRGSRGVWLRNAAGLEMAVIAERGMSVTDLSLKGIPLPFVTAAGTVHPAYTEPRGTGWLRTWPAGFLTSCGLTQVGSPCVDEGEELGLHGRLASLPARNLRWGADWHGDDYVVWVEGTVRETTMFAENVLLSRRIWTGLNDTRFWIEDRVENLGFNPAPHMFLQHINLGFPLIDAETRLELPPHVTTPRDEDAQMGVEHYCEFHQPEAGYREQVFYHDLEPDAEGQVEVSLVNPGFDNGRGLGVSLRYAKAQYPILVQWKMMGEGFYVVGLEPANCHVGGRCQERAQGSLPMLAPLEARDYRLEIDLIAGV